jgi:hypothetical protein
MKRKLQYGNSVAPLAILLLVSVAAGPARAHPPDHDHAHHDQVHSGTDHGTLGEVGAKLSNPVSDVWALFTEFDLSFSDGNFNRGDAKVGSAMNFQPILPVPLAEDWKIIVRPSVPIQFNQPQPDSPPQNYDYEAGLSDIILPLPISPVLGNWIVAAGPTFLFPTATSRDLGKQQWGMGPAAVLGYKTPDYVVGVFPQYFWKLADRGDQRSRTPDLSQGNLLYFAFYNLPNAWQIGFNPVITYDHKAKGSNKWNVPVGMGFSKTTKIGNMPVKFQLAVEYSVVSQDDFGKRALIKLNVIPVIQALMKEPIF